MTMPPEIIETLRDAAAELVRENGAEHRADGRIAVGTTVAVTVTPVDAYSSTCTMKMKVADFSGGGIGLLCGETISVGSDVEVLLPDKAGRRFNLRCSVCSCKGVADGVFRVGVRFEGMEK